MKIKPVYLGIAAGALLLLGKKGGAKAADIAKASALATAEAASNAYGPSQKKKEQEEQIKIAGESLVPASVRGAATIFDLKIVPTLDEFIALFVINKNLLRDMAKDTFARMYAEAKARSYLFQEAILGHIPVEKRLALAIDMMTPQQTRLFSADCLENALPVFEKAFPGNGEGAKLIRGIRLFSEGKVSASELSRQAKIVSKLCETKNTIAVSFFGMAATCAGVTKETYAELAKTAPSRVKTLMLDSLKYVQKASSIAKHHQAMVDVKQAHDKANPTKMINPELSDEEVFRIFDEEIDATHRAVFEGAERESKWTELELLEAAKNQIKKGL